MATKETPITLPEQMLLWLWKVKKVELQLMKSEKQEVKVAFPSGVESNFSSILSLVETVIEE